VIGVQLPIEKILRALPSLSRNRRPSARSFAELSLAICTTDTRPKTASASFKMAGARIHLVGCAKGAGMIHPNMATTLAFVVTDAAISPSVATYSSRRYFAPSAHQRGRNTSTNDTLLVLINGAPAPSISNGSKAHRQFAASLEEVCGSLAQQIVADGEGAQRVIEIEVRERSRIRRAKSRKPSPLHLL
jgi:glutamate N-acetyltransferase/amino-acid N-acetyltransferase